MEKRELSLPLLILVGLFALPLTAQPVIDRVDDLDFDRPEAWAMKYFTSVSLLTGLGVPEASEAGAVLLGFEAGLIPSLDEDQRRVGFDGRKVEDLNKTSVFGRLRLGVGLPRDFTLTLGWVPPVELGGAKPNLLSLAIGRPLVEADSWRMGLRLYGQYGKVEGDFTCSEDVVGAGNDPNLNPFGCEEVSKDEVTQNYVGVELSSAFRSGEALEPYVAVTLSYMDLEFAVDAKYFGFIDRSVLRTDGVTYSVAGGLSWQLTDAIGLSGEVFYSPLDVVRRPRTSSENDPLFHVRGLATYRLR